jgi:hypothetical protein
MSHVLDENKTIPAIASLCSYITEFIQALQSTRISFDVLPRTILDLLGGGDPYSQEELAITSFWLISTSVDAVDPRSFPDPNVLPGFKGSHEIPHTWADDLGRLQTHVIPQAFAYQWPGPVNFWMRGSDNSIPFPQFAPTGLAASAWLISNRNSRRRKVVSHRV